MFSLPKRPTQKPERPDCQLGRFLFVLYGALNLLKPVLRKCVIKRKDLNRKRSSRKSGKSALSRRRIDGNIPDLATSRGLPKGSRCLRALEEPIPRKIAQSVKRPVFPMFDELPRVAQ